MNKESLITVKTPQLPIDRFEQFMAATTEKLKEDGQKSPQYYRSQDGERFEPIVFDAMRSLASDFSFSPDLIIRTKKQHFPDILSEHYFGVEVKTTKSNSWRSTGSSIVESLRDENVKRIYMMFGKLSAKAIDFRCKPYEQCLDDISVTHSPRYDINMDIKEPSKTIFDKLGIPYEEFRQSQDQIKMVKEYYRNKCKSNNKEMPWWIDDEHTEMPFMPESLNSSSIRLFNGLTPQEIDYLRMCAYILFPEVLGTDRDKYQNLALWLCSRHSIISPNIRDSFTAGGQANIYLDDSLTCAKSPRVLCNFLKMQENIYMVFKTKSDVYNEIPFYSSYSEDKEDLYAAWKQTATTFLKKTLGAKKLPIEKIFDVRFVGEDVNGLYFETI